MKKPFGTQFAETVQVETPALAYDAKTQSATLNDQQLAGLAASENTLTGTINNDNDFDD